MRLPCHSYVKLATILDNVCIESLSIDLTRPMLDAAARSVDKLADKIDEQVPNSQVAGWDIDSLSRIKKTDASKLQDEYAKLVEGLQEAASDEDAFMSNPGQDRTPPTTAV